jgi:DNA-binding NtrC family response regulator
MIPSGHVLLQAAESLAHCRLCARLAQWISASSLEVEWKVCSPRTVLPGYLESIVVHQPRLDDAKRFGLSLLERYPHMRILALGCGVLGSDAGDPPALEGGMADLSEDAMQAVCCESPTALWEVASWMHAHSQNGNLLPGSEVLPGIVGWSAVMTDTARKVPRIAESDATCLLLGETGTGKELFARALHYLSARAKCPFVPINCGAIAEHLFENELFGHAQGAYTDARSKESGLLAFAEGGTLFLDEVDSLSTAAQVKLLRLLQEREYRPVGSARTIKANVRIVAATNAGLLEMVAERRFREDLYHRLNVLRLTVPPLRQRLDDVPLLASYFMRDFSFRYRKKAGVVESLSLSRAAISRLVRYSWPGHVREMHGVIERAVLMSNGPVIDAEGIDLPDGNEASHPPAPRLPSPPFRQPVANLRPATWKAAKDLAILQFERDYLAEVLSNCAGNISRAARIAGKERRSFQRLLRKHDYGAQSAPPRPNA